MELVLKPVRKHPVLLGIVLLVLIEFSFNFFGEFAPSVYELLGDTFGYYAASLTYEIPPMLLAFAAVIWLGGRHALSCTVLKHSAWLASCKYFLIISFLPSFLDFTDYLAGNASLQPGWEVALIMSVVLDLAVGVYEECEFRGVVFGLIVPRFGKSRAGVIFAMAVASLIFGAAHVDFTILSDQSSYIQAALKTVQTGIIGFYFCAVALREKSLWPAIILHFIWNFAIDISIVPFEAPSSPEYIVSGEEAAALIKSYLWLIAIELPLVYQGLRVAFKLDLPYGGWFARVCPKEEISSELPATEPVTLTPDALAQPASTLPTPTDPELTPEAPAPSTADKPTKLDGPPSPFA